MKKQQTEHSLYSEELEQLNFDQTEEEVRELFEQENIPTPSQLERYEQLMHNGAERVFNLIEDERMHQRKMETRRLRGRTILSYLVSFFGFIFSVVLLIVINDLTVVGGSWIALVLGWLTMMVVLLLTFAPFIRSRLGGKN